MSDIYEPIKTCGTTYTYLMNGKVKDVYTNTRSLLLFDFTDKISAFDKSIPSLIPGKGESICRSTAHWFKAVEEAQICKTHYIDIPSSTRMVVKKAQIVLKPTIETDECYIPLEVISRYYLAGSLFGKIKKGKVDFKDLGFNSMPKEGDRLPEPMIEFETKYEEVDRKIPEQEAMEIAGLTKGELENIIDTVYAIDNLIEKEVVPRGLIHIDGKKEFMFGSGRELMLADTFGTGDEDRFVDKEALENGQILDLSKEPVRKYYKDNGYHGELIKIREENKIRKENEQPLLSEPEISGLPEEMVNNISDIYKQLYGRLTGDNF